jgi:hypothetical protein
MVVTTINGVGSFFVEEERGQGGGANAPLSTNCGSVEGEEAARERGGHREGGGATHGHGGDGGDGRLGMKGGRG